ncbi:MAG: hydrogenase maturation nickel metallochaperone HypA [Deltaproteobacteria bacterium]|nr:hydrogenase maturation nickel metallochaperone HypA [Deltaproteobacteria bacterium]
MHELTLAHRICQTVAAHVTATQRVVTVVLEWGPLCGVVAEAIEYCFPIAAEANGLGGARLELRRLPARARCSACGARFEVQEMWDGCPGCQHVPVTVEGGTEFRLKQIEVEDV